MTGVVVVESLPRKGKALAWIAGTDAADIARLLEAELETFPGVTNIRHPRTGRILADLTPAFDGGQAMPRLRLTTIDGNIVVAPPGVWIMVDGEGFPYLCHPTVFADRYRIVHPDRRNPQV